NFATVPACASFSSSPFSLLSSRANVSWWRSADAISMQNVAACFFAALFIFLELYFAIPAPVIQGSAKRAGVLPQVLKRARHFTFKKVKAC
ncbi:hypothetical protein QLZ14_20390, partial [Cronobacter sakazakii]|nr:hypothetical protein [Cronobacter sakazakii]